MSNDNYEKHDDHTAYGARRKLLKLAAGAATATALRGATGLTGAAMLALQSGAARADDGKVLRIGFQKVTIQRLL